MRTLRTTIGLVMLCVLPAQVASAQSYQFNVLYQGNGNATLAPGSADPAATTLNAGDSFLWRIAAQSGFGWRVVNSGSFFPFMAFGVNEPGVRVGDYTLSLLWGGSSVFSYSELGADNRYVHLGTNTIDLTAGLRFDAMELSYALVSAVDDQAFGGDPNNPLPIGTTPNTLLPIFGAPDQDPYHPGDVAYEATVVPEPGTWVLMAFGLVLLACVRSVRARKRRRALPIAAVGMVAAGVMSGCSGSGDPTSPITTLDVEARAASSPAVGSIYGTVTSPQRGPLAGISVVSGVISAATTTSGTYVLTNVPIGTMPVKLTGLPAGCVNPPIRIVPVYTNTAVRADISVSCATWTAGPDMQSARQWPAVTAYNGAVYAAGGFNSSAADLSSIEIFNPNTNSWSAGPFMPAKRYGGTGLQAIGSRLYLVGGFSYPQIPQNQFFMYDFGASSWFAGVPATAPGGCGASGVVGQTLFVLTGCTSSTVYAAYLSSFTVGASTWTTLPMAPDLHVYPAAAVIGNKFYVIGGINSIATTVSGRVDVFNTATNQWSQVASMPTARYGATAQAVNGKIYVIGGKGGAANVLSTVEIYDPATNTWTTGLPMPTARVDAGSAAINGKIYVVGGSNGGQTYYKKLEIFTP